MQYTIVGSEDGTSNITVFVKGGTPLVAHSTHANYEEIVKRVVLNDMTAVDLFDVAQTAVAKFERLGDTVTTANGRLYHDGVEVNNALAEQVVRFLNEGVDDWKPLVAFFENVQANPVEHSREQLYGWLAGEDFTITSEGLIVGYKGVTDRDGKLFSIHHGTAIVDGEVMTGAIPNEVGSIIEMPRDQVTHDPAIACHQGLHVGTYNYAKNFGRVVLEVHVNPRDVVSVPADHSQQKMRVCRYTVIKKHEGEKYEAAVLPVEEESDANVLEATPKDDGKRQWATGYGTLTTGDVYENTDRRRKGVTFEVESANAAFVHGISQPSGLRRSIAVKRLFSRAYRKI